MGWATFVSLGLHFEGLQVLGLGGGLFETSLWLLNKLKFYINFIFKFM